MTPELHRPVAVERVVHGGMEVEVRASEAECRALALRMAIPAVLDCLCRFRLHAAPGGVVLAEGHLRARTQRQCVVTLEAFESVTEERFRLRFVPAGSETNDDDPESDDEIPYRDGTLDLGEATAEQLALVLDPYPRKPDAALPDPAGPAPESPFAVLARRPPRH